MGQPYCPRALFTMPICLLDSTVVIDTNAFPLLARAAFQCVTGLFELRAGVGSKEIFINTLGELLGSLCGCARGNNLLTTTFAYDQEMDPNIQGWVFEEMPYLTELYESDVYRTQIQEMLRVRIQRIPVPEEDAAELLGILRRAGFDGLSFVDATLILLGLRFARQGNAFLVSDDNEMLDAIQWLQRANQVEIRGEIYPTREPNGLLLLEASRSVHACCALDSDRYRYVFSAYDTHLWERQTQGTIPAEVLISRTRTLSEVRTQIHAERAAKMGVAAEVRQDREMAEITDELARRWLGEDER